MALNIHSIGASQSWRRRGWAVLFGVCAAAALPPVYALPLLIPAFSGLFLLVSAATTKRQAFLDGWWWGLGHFVAGLYWICISLYVDPVHFAWLTPFALFGLPSVIAIYIGLVTLGLYWICATWSISRTAQIIVLAGLWVVAEYLRAHLFTGFPWNLIGYAWTLSDITIQLGSVIGIYGLSWLAIIIATMPVLFLLKEDAKLPNLASLSLLVAMIVFGIWRLDAHPTQYTDTKLRIVQGNIAQSMKWDAKTELAGLQKYADLTRSPGIAAVNVVIWPETAVPYFIVPDSRITHDLGSVIPSGTVLVTGGLRGLDPDNAADREKWQSWNSLFAIDHEGRILSRYDKHHLVPFGEYVPLRKILPLENIAGGIGDFSRGSGPATLTMGQYFPYSPLICYEAIFPGEATDGSGHAKWLINITNDAWFGMSSGPYQHLQMARMRAVEQGVPLVRAANTGVSAVFDPLGRLLVHLPLGKEGVLDWDEPQPLESITILNRYSAMPILFIIALSMFFTLLPNKLIRRA